MVEGGRQDPGVWGQFERNSRCLLLPLLALPVATEDDEGHYEDDGENDGHSGKRKLKFKC